MKHTNLLVQDISGAWAQIGTGATRGIVPSNIELTSDSGGPKQATFDLTREPWVNWPDIQAYAPLEAWTAGKRVWKGRIVEAPMNDEQRNVTVRCEGLQAHLDDDQYERTYVHTDLTKWVDARTFLSTDLARFTATPQVTAGNGTISLGWPKGTAATNPDCVGVILDLGASSEGAKYLVIDYRRMAGTPANLNLYARAAADPSHLVNGGLPSDEASFSNLNGASWAAASTRLETTLTSGYRYVCIFVYCATSYTPTTDDLVVIENAEVYTSGLYYDSTNNVSILSGDTVVKDAVNKATIFIDSDQSQISSDAGAEFYLPEFDPDGPRTPRQITDSVNAFYDYLVKVDENARMHFRPQPTVPAVSVGRWGASTFNDASAASGDDIFNRVLVTGNDPSGNPIRSSITSAQLPDAKFAPVTAPSFVNPTFDADVTGWTGSVRTYDTTTKYAGAGSMRFDRTGGPATFTSTTSAVGSFNSGDTFYRGVTYLVTFYVKGSSAPTRLWARLGNIGLVGGTIDYATRTDYGNEVTTTGWTQVSISWTPQYTVTSANVSMVLLGQQGYYYWFDSFAISTAIDTIPDKRGFVKTHTLDAGFMLTQASAARLGSLYLKAHRFAPFKGEGQVVGSRSARDYATGDYVAPEDLLLRTGELMHFDDRIDPDTGNLGRDGRLVNVVYRPDTDTASFSIDNTRGDFDTLLSRVGVKVGQIR